MVLRRAQAGVILIVDDSPLNQKMLTAMVEGLAEVHCASDGEQGLLLAQQLHPNLILLDVEMPGMNGYEVCRALRHQPNFDSAIMIITAHRGDEYEIKALRAGAVDFVSKPFNEDVVKARVKTHLLLNQQTRYLQSLVNLDALTGVFNRRHFNEVLLQEWRRHLRLQMPLALAMVDVDHFKRFNDKLGHQAGDDCLKSVAQCLSRSVRRPGEIVSRYGGEEFAIILPAIGPADALSVGQWLSDQVAGVAIAHPDREDGMPTVTVSVGVCAITPRLDASPKWLVAAADAALYLAKEKGRNQACLGEFPHSA
ncbi:GGDEF domain-containing response regulator [Chitinibacter tainanensis]|uniref:GGDEF domain-containing response regulator n=1 Tax=Chitinibacter tainanensis TaxID=230667 RepID=UPI00041FC865|nr:diguanylate cyclase [Chitinibacter tainanensis]